MNSPLSANLKTQQPASNNTQHFVTAVALITIAGGCVVLFGWALDIDALKSILPSLTSMKANTAVAFVLSGIALWLLAHSESAHHPSRARQFVWLCRLIAPLPGLLGALVLIEYIWHLDLGIDQLLFTEAVGTVGTAFPGRMAAETATSFVLISIALILNSLHTQRQNLLFIATSCGVLLVSFAIGASLPHLSPHIDDYRWVGYTNMAVHTALLLILLGVALVRLSWHKSNMHWAMSNALSVAFLCGLSLLTIVGFNTFRSQLLQTAISQRVLDNEVIIADLQNILIEVVDAQAHMRGYVITGDNEFKENYLEARKVYIQKLHAIKQLAITDHHLQQDIEQIEQRFDQDLNWLAHNIEEERHSKDDEQRRQMVLRGEKFLNELRSRLNEIEVEHHQYTQELKQYAIAIEHQSNLFISVGTVISLLIFLFSLLRLNRAEFERRLTEAQNQRLTDMYAALSHCNQAIVHCTSQDELFAQICLDVVKFGGLQMAWIGMIDEHSKRIQPVVTYGIGKEYVEGITISTDANLPEGRGPTGIAARENKPYWCQDFLQSPATAPWHERASLYGWRSSAALPLLENDAVVGTLTLYSAELNAFDEPIRNLLEEMAIDISFALGGFAKQREGERLKKTLQEKESLIQLAGHIAHVGGWAVEMLPTLRLVWSDEVCVLHDMPIGTQPTLEQAIAFYAPESLTKIKEVVNLCMTEGTPFDEELQIITAKQRRIWVHAIGHAVRDGEGVITRIQGAFQDINELKLAEEHAQRLANFDLLTGLPNRSWLNDRAKFTLSLAQRNHGTLSLMFLDLDRFKYINDTLGHEVGDQLLMQVASRLKSVVREEDTVSRTGGDEFILLLPNADTQGAANVARKILESFAQPFQIDQHEIATTPSIGIAMYPDDGNTFDLLSKAADAAMYRAKEGGRDAFRFYASEMQSKSARTLLLSTALRHALKYNQLSLHYQPQVSLANQRINGAEALLRWSHPELGTITPSEFIPIAEDSGQIIQIGEWVLRTAVQQMKTWIDIGMPPIVIAVNLSALQFHQANLADLISTILNDAQLPPQFLELELTEGVAMDDPLGAIEIMDKLHGRGIRMSIDDFGTGYSSLSYLKRFQIYKLKIDQSFVRDIDYDSDDKAIVSAVISMANSLGMKTIAEGVETAEQLEFLRARGCNEVQGYFFSKPLPAEEFEAFVRSAALLPERK